MPSRTFHALEKRKRSEIVISYHYGVFANTRNLKARSSLQALFRILAREDLDVTITHMLTIQGGCDGFQLGLRPELQQRIARWPAIVPTLHANRLLRVLDLFFFQFLF